MTLTSIPHTGDVIARMDGTASYEMRAWMEDVERQLQAGIAYVSALNSSTADIGAGLSFDGVYEYNTLPDVMVSCKCTGSATLRFFFSNDGGATENEFPVNGFSVSSGVHEFHVAVKGPRSFRVQLDDSGGAGLTNVDLYSYYGVFRQPNSPLNAVISQDADAIITKTTNELEVMKGKVDGEYIIQKYGLNPDVDGATDICDCLGGASNGPYAGFPISSAENIEVLSSSANDTNSSGTGARKVRIFYLDDNYNMFDSSGNYLYVDVNLNGTTGVDSGVSGMRVWRAKVIDSGSGQENAGDITVRWITTTSVVFTIIRAGYSQSEITSFTVPNGYTGYLKVYTSEMTDNTSNSAQMAIKTREFGSNTFRLVRPFVTSTDKDFNRTMYGGEVFDEKSDLVFRCTSVTNANGIITVSFGIHLVKNL